jgi:hypothetical protein
LPGKGVSSEMRKFKDKNTKMLQNLKSRSQTAFVLALVLPLTNWITLSKVLHFSVLSLFPLCKNRNNRIYLRELVVRIK